MASNGDENLNTPNNESMPAPTTVTKKKRGRPRKSEIDLPTPRKSARQSDQKQLKTESTVLKTKQGEISLDSEEEWSFDEEDEDYLASMFKKLNNNGAAPKEEVEEEEDDDDLDYEEEDEEEDEDDDDDLLFQEDEKDVYDFDQQSSIMSQQGPRMTRKWLSKQNKHGNLKSDIREGSSWGFNIYSHVATLLNTREDLDIYSRFLKCSHINRGLDSIIADLCKPFRVSASEGSSASLQSLLVKDSNVVNLVKDIASERFDNAAHRITHFVVLVKQPIGGLRFCTGSLDTLHFNDILHCIDPKIVGEAAFIVEAEKTDLKKTVADVDTIVVSDAFHSVICNLLLSSPAAHLQRVVLGMDDKRNLFGIFLLDYWNRAGVPYNRPKKYASTCPTETLSECNTENTMTFIDSFFVRMGGKKGVIHLVAKVDSKFIVYNVISEYKFAFKRHGLSPITPIMLEGMFSTFPEVLSEEKSVLVVPDQLYRSLAKTTAKEVQSPSCKFKKCVLLDKKTHLPLGLFFDTEVTIDLQVNDTVSCGEPLTILSQTSFQSLKPTTENIQLVSLNGILVGFECSPSSKSVIKCFEVVSDSSAVLKPHLDRRHSVQTIYLSSEGVSATVQLSNLESNENTFVSASLYDNVPYCKRQEHIENYLNDIADHIFDLPLQISLFDSLFRMYQKSAKEAVTDNQSVALTSKCVFCHRDFRTAALYDHESRHLGLVKFKCHKHQMVFGEMKSYRCHREEYLNCDSDNGENITCEMETQKLLNISTNITECPQCPKCYDYFPQSGELLSHHLDLCDGVSFRSRTPLEVGGDNGEICGLCGLGYVKMDALCSHMHSHLTCNVCKSRLASIEEVSSHIREHIVKKESVSGRGMRKIFTCDICQDFWGTKMNYYYHQWQEHGVVHPPIKSEQSGKEGGLATKRQSKKKDQLAYMATGLKKFSCKFCLADVKVSGKTYQKHLDTKHGLTVDVDCICRICAEVCETTERLSEHLRARHIKGGEYVNAGVQSIFSCDKCTFFGHFLGVVNHSTTVHCDPNPCLYECPLCPERMLDRRLWRLHLEKHDQLTVSATTVTNNSCGECFLHFQTFEELAEHSLTFHGVIKTNELKSEINGIEPQEFAPPNPEASFQLLLQCDLCKKTCKTAKAYELHRMKHFRTRIFQCTECQATFRSKLAMRRHIRVDHLHLEPERYECQICGKIVTQISMHMLIHKNARYQCEFCDRRFTKSAYYNEHVRIHKGEKPYECHICMRRFNKKSNLNVHISFHEKHRDDYGNYLEIKPRGRGHPDYDPEKTKARKTAMIRHDVNCGPDEPGICIHNDLHFKIHNVLTNSKTCDTTDLESHYLDLFS